MYMISIYDLTIECGIQHMSKFEEAKIGFPCVGVPLRLHALDSLQMLTWSSTDTTRADRATGKDFDILCESHPSGVVGLPFRRARGRRRSEVQLGLEGYEILVYIPVPARGGGQPSGD